MSEIEENREQEINRLYDEICSELRTTVQKAIRIGELLVAQKRECGHGNWLPWLRANVKFSKSTAENFMNAYKRKSKFPTVGNLKELYGYLKDVVDVEAEKIPEPEPKPSLAKRYEAEIQEFMSLSEEEQETRIDALMHRDPRTLEENEFLIMVCVERERANVLEYGKILNEFRESIMWLHGGKAWHSVCWCYFGPPEKVDCLIEDAKDPSLFKRNDILEKHSWRLSYWLYKAQSKYFEPKSTSKGVTLEEFIEKLDEGYEAVSTAIGKDYEEWLPKHEAELEAEPE